MNRQLLSQQLSEEYGITLNRLDSSILLKEVNDKQYTPYHSSSEFLIIAQNPTS